MQHHMILVLTGQIKVTGFMNVGQFAKLSPPLSQDTVTKPDAMISVEMG